MAAADRAIAGAAAAGKAWLWATVGLTAGALVAVVMLAPAAGAPPVRALSWLLFTGSSVHVASTGWLFTVPAVRDYARAHQVRCLWIPAGLIASAATVAMLIPPASFQWLLLPYFGWQFYHYQKQNLGMAALASAAHGIRPLSRDERGPLLLAGIAVLAAIGADPRLVGLHLSISLAWLDDIAAVAFAVAAATGVAALLRRPAGERRRGFAAVYLTSLLFGLPIFVFTSPYAAVGGMTLAHGLQYLLLVGVAAGNGRHPRRPPLVRLALLANIALIGGAALSAASHLHNAAPGGRLIFGAYLGVVMAHFVIDAGIWRMRDPLARRFVAESLPFLGKLAPSTVTDPSSTDIGCTS